jgi:isoleucyl-tRNA synthetase
MTTRWRTPNSDKYFEQSDIQKHRQEIEELFIVSKVVIKPTEGEETITVTRASDHGMKKCVRCWKYYEPEKIGTHAEHPELCERCAKVVVDLKF